MFKRVFVEDWALYIPFISFFIFVTVFIAVSIRALRMKEADRKHLASMPLDDSSSDL